MNMKKFSINSKNLKKFFFTRRFVHFGLFMLCLIFAIYDLLSKLGEYQDTRNYIITPTFRSPSLIDLPTISICLTNYIDDKKVQKYYPDQFDFKKLKESKIKEKMEFYASQLSIRQLLNVSYYFDEIFDGCELLMPDGRMGDCRFLNFTKVWLSLETKCYQFFHNLTLKYSPSKIKGVFWLSLRIKKERRDGSNLGFLLNAPNKTLEPFISNSAYFLISTSVLYTIMLTYSKEITQKLEAPFDTNCKNYTHPHIDQLNCSHSCCIRKLVKDNSSFWPSGLQTGEIESDLFFKKIENYHLDFKGCIKKECFEQDCISTRYLINAKYEKFNYSNDSKFTIRLIYNFAPEILIKYQPRIAREFSSVLSFITSPLSFYLGIAFFNLFSFFVTCLEIPYELFKKYVLFKKQN